MSKVTCIDVSCWQSNVNYSKVKASGIEAVIIRAGFGRESSQKDNEFETHYRNAKTAGLKLGAYWYSYADSVSDAEKEAEACLLCIKSKKFDMPVYYDMEENSQRKLGKTVLTQMAEAFCNAVKAGGYEVGVYSNLDWFNNSLDYQKLKKEYSIWLAQYNSVNQLDCDIWQNSSTGNIGGVSGDCDTNVIFNRKVLGGSSETTSTTASSSKKKTNEQIASEVIAGKWGNGTDRKTKLTKAGYDYSAIQKLVNEKLGTASKKTVDELAKEVIAGKWGNGTDRKTKLAKAGYDYDAVQKRVNELL